MGLAETEDTPTQLLTQEKSFNINALTI